MRILVANIPLPANRFLVDLNASLSEFVELEHSSDRFWNMQGDYAVVHLHFPEYLTYEIEKAYQTGLSDDLIAGVAERLDFWRGRARIMVTRHVLLPHNALRDPQWEKMYETVYARADGVVHFDQPSVDEFKQRYGSTSFLRGEHPVHTVVPHQNYSSLPSGITRAEARKKLGISDSASVMLVFGAIRSIEERELIMNTFEGIKLKGKMLLVSRWKETLPNVSWIRLKYWLRDLKRLYYRLHPSFRFGYGFVNEEDAQIYLEAADVLFIPRLWVLNSGNITLGMTFGRVVVGPNAWDVGSLLSSTGNPVFDPDSPETAVAAMEEGFRLAKEGRLGESNRQIALNEWTPRQCAEKYFAFYKSITGNSELTNSPAQS